MVRKNEAMRCISAGIGSSATPRSEVNSSGCWLTYTMSARRVSAQKPASSIGNSDGSGRMPGQSVAGAQAAERLGRARRTAGSRSRAR